MSGFQGASQKNGVYVAAPVQDVYNEPPFGYQGHQTPVTRRLANHSPMVWILEIVTSLTSVACLAAIAAIFYYVDGKPLSAWTNKISLNATISILTTACTAALMHGVSEFISQHKWSYFRARPLRLENFETFDGASRGLWGSVKLIFTVGWNLATLGAFITIARLAIAPLTQQVVQLEQQMVPRAHDDATFGFAHSYNRELTGFAFLVAQSIPQDAQMQSAIVQGLYDINVPAQFSCPGACRWTGTYVTLGFKTECGNVTEATLSTETCDDESYPITCNMTTPAGLELTTHRVPTASGTSYRMAVSPTIDNTFPSALPDDFPLIARFAVYRSTADENYEPTNPNITDCSLSLAAYEYTDARANGSDFQFGKTREIETKGWKWQPGTSRGLFYTNSSEADGLPALETTWHEIKAVQNFFTSETFATEWIEGSNDNKNPGLSAALTGDVKLPERFAAMATSMTNYVRTGPNMEVARGEYLEAVPFVVIRWYWFIGPAVIEVAVLVFLVLTIFHNRKSREIPVWKSSALAVLACQHDENSGTIQTRMKNIDELRREDGKKKARLESW